MLERFRAAIATGEVLRVIYDGGSSPGSIRDIQALEVLSDGKVRAKCLTTRQAKTFILEKMRLREDAEETYAPAGSKLRQYTSLSEVFMRVAEGIRELGWHVQFEDDEGEWACLSAHRIATKTRKPMKGSFASLTYTPVQWDAVVTVDGGFERVNVRPSERPYAVRSKHANSTPTFRDLDKAVERFLEAVRAVPPHK